MKMFSLEGKVAIITGGGRGIGAAIARIYAEAGAAVALTARTVEQVESVAAEIRAAGGRALPIAANLYDNAQLPAVIDKTVAEFGGIDVLVNNAGAGGSPLFMDTRAEHMQQAYQLMVVAPFELARLAAPSMLQRPGASIINMTSVGAYRHTRGNLAHHTAKGAMAQFTRLLAADLGPKIRVNAIAPAAVETPGLREVFDSRAPGMRETIIEHTRLRRMGTPEDIAYAALYLASPAASWITGTVLDITGGPVDELFQNAPDL
ncbi:7-alpha-hydroxysteroid dehydrogenase [Novosphingobium sp. CF614]|uniref:SDR family NAD(P)-dependent oxidoreductase n=1 Tax=Novosphingobium sp. CF614 TaxID=1884364 RepID=UPI0008E94762|nr:glucose 1-dehydrogenase [Novosphingobium sp. CF614]SFF77308.1 7-alpha-hydroxysteroid dehydrogenase [Novosphingobium sp. CF614]